LACASRLLSHRMVLAPAFPAGLHHRKPSGHLKMPATPNPIVWRDQLAPRPLRQLDSSKVDRDPELIPIGPKAMRMTGLRPLVPQQQLPLLHARDVPVPHGLADLIVCAIQVHGEKRQGRKSASMSGLLL